MIERDSDTLLSAMIDQETGLRGYITTADPVFLQPFYQGRKAYLIIFPQLAQILRDEKYKNTNTAFTRSNLLAEKWYNSFALIQLRLIHDKIYAKARSVQEAKLGKAMFDAFRNATKQFKNIVNEDTGALHHSTNLFTNSTILVITIATFLLLTFIWFIIQKFLTT